MLNYLLMCRSLTYAQRASRTLEHAGITATITKAPKSATGVGCGYCVKVSEKKLAPAIAALNKAGLGPARIFMLSENGFVSEVEL
ncbi:MAG: DUF3343 domain-containing protein [Oscillospiraceae bacterium]|nr:DUF3343 domain-containing protein [Oscillospiraceae bacterium]